MSFSTLRNFARDILLLLPPVRRLHSRAAELGWQAEALQRDVNSLQPRLLDAESRNALIPGLEREVKDLATKLLEAEAHKALIPGLERQVQDLGAKLLDAESRNALIPGLEREAKDLGAKLLDAESRNALIPGLEREVKDLATKLLEAEAHKALIPGLERQAQDLGAKLLDAESRNALIPGLERQAKDLGAKLLEAEAHKALIPGLERQAQELGTKLLDAEARNALIPGLERQAQDLGAKLLEAEAHKALIPGLERQAQELGTKLLDAEARNALIPGLERQAEELQAKLAVSEACNVRIPVLEQAAQAARERLKEAEDRNKRIPLLEGEAARLLEVAADAERHMRERESAQRAELAGANETIGASRRAIAELEAMQIEMHVRLGELARVEDRLDALPRGRAGGRRAAESGGARALAIGMYGNTNNFPLLLAEGFRALGHEVRLVVNSRAMLHRPEGKYPAWRDNYPDWIFDCSSMSEESMLSGAAPLLGKVIERFYGEVDLVILNEHGPALSAWLPRPQLAFLTGSDLTYHANYDSLEVRAAAWDPAFKASPQGRRQVARFADYVSRQRDGILAADVVSYGLRGLIAEGDALLDGIGVSDARRMFILLADTAGLTTARAPRHESLRILNGARISWLPDPQRGFCAQDLKGTDILLRGFAAYCARGGQGELRLFRKSQDVESAATLCEQLGIGERVVWLPEMPLADFHQEMRQADLVCDQLAGSFPGMVTMDAYALGRPVLANFRNETFCRHFAEPLPGYQAATPGEVAEHLLCLEADREPLKAMGKRSRKFAERYLSPQAMAEQVLERVGLAPVRKANNV